MGRRRAGKAGKVDRSWPELTSILLARASGDERYLSQSQPLRAHHSPSLDQLLSVKDTTGDHRYPF